MKERERKSVVGFLAAIFGLMVLSTVLIGGIMLSEKQNSSNRVALENLYRSGFSDFKTGVDNMEMNLSKLLVTTEDCESCELAHSAYLSSQTAILGLSVLPIESETYHKTSKLINQVGDLCNCYGQALSRKENADAYAENFDKVYQATSKLKTAVDGISEDMLRADYRIINGKLDDFSPLNLKDTKQNTFEYPEIIYDGPFSDATEKKCFLGLMNMKEIDMDDAVRTVNDLFGEYGISSVKVVGESDQPDAYVIEAKMRGRDVFITVSKQGGKVVGYDSGFTVRVSRLSEEVAKQKAIVYAQNFGYGDMTPVWYNSYEGVAYVNLAPKIDDIVYYTDLVKVKVGLDNGKLIGLEAMGYCAYHHERQPKFNVSENTAINQVSKKLSIKNVRKALIPLRGKEIFCYEVYASYNDLDYLVYIDAVSGKQVNIMRVIDDYQGKMVI